MRKLKLTQGKFAIVDDEWYDVLNQYKWYARWDKHTRSFYAVRNGKYADGKKQIVRMHREILGLGRGDGKQGDHKNHDTLNNQEYNLRICVCSQNQQNQTPQCGMSSKYKGVCWNKRDKRWYVQIGLGMKQHYLGSYADEELAAMAYDLVARKAFGKFAKLNF